jgi:phosphoribosylglycinamide formyltransferase-1
MADKQRIVVFASGTKNGGGSGFENLVRYAREGGAGFQICAVVSNRLHGGVEERAKRLDVPFVHFGGPWDTGSYQSIVEDMGTPWVVLSGWLKPVVGLDPARTINIHPALLSFQNGRFGGQGLYGHHVHEAVAQALEKGELDEKKADKNGDAHKAAYSGFTMHFVTNEYDRGPILAEVRVPIKKGMTADDIQKTVGSAEHMWQPILTDMVVRGQIRLDDGRVVAPLGYGLLPR